MSFVSGAFLLFLPLAITAYWLCSPRRRWIVLLVASLIFCLSWDRSCVLLLLGEITAAWLSCLIVERYKGKWLFALLVTVLFLPLFGYKYSYFVLDSVLSATGWAGQGFGLRSPLLPVGISFYTFQAVSCVIDVYRQEQRAERNWFRFALFVSFFPQLVAGPIERAGKLMPQLRAEKPFSFDDLCAGTRLVLAGFFQKVCVADALAPYVDRFFSQQAPDGSIAALGAILFAFQIYFDFAGYAAIALGSARMLGIRLTRNFHSPYQACGMRDFWRRWHITLTQWFQAYVYRPLGGSRHGIRRQMLASGTVFLLSGLWHGANWTFVCWGTFHAVCYALETMLRRGRNSEAQGWKKGAVIVLTFALVCLSWILFRSESMAQAMAYYRAIFSPWHIQEALAVADVTGMEGVAWLLRIVVALLIEPWAYGEKTMPSVQWSVAVGVLMLLSIAMCWLGQLSSGMHNAFIYFQF